MNRQMESSRLRASQVLGGAIASMCGLALYWLLPIVQEAMNPAVGATASTYATLTIVALVGVASAYLMRNWWALLITPACFLVGWYLGGVIDALLPGRLYKPWDLAGLGEMLGIFAIWLAPPLLIGAVVGAVVSQLARTRRPRGLPSSLPRTAPIRPPASERDRPPATVS